MKKKKTPTIISLNDNMLEEFPLKSRIRQDGYQTEYDMASQAAIG